MTCGWGGVGAWGGVGGIPGGVGRSKSGGRLGVDLERRRRNIIMAIRTTMMIPGRSREESWKPAFSVVGLELALGEGETPGREISDLAGRVSA